MEHAGEVRKAKKNGVHGSVNNPSPVYDSVFFENFADISSGFITWSMLSQLILSIFFNPMVEMKWSGWEIFLVSYFSPCLLGFPVVWKFASRYFYLFRFLGLIGLFSFYLDQIEFRLGLLGIGVLLDFLGLFGMWSSSALRRNHYVRGFLFGLIVMVIVRLFFRSLNPVWNFLPANILALFLGLINFYLYHCRETSTEPLTSTTSNYWTSWKASIALGGVLFLIHLLFSNYATAARWVGLPPFPTCLFVIGSMMAGIVFSNRLDLINRKIYWFITAGIGWFLFAAWAGSLFPPIVELFGAMLLAIYTFSVFGTIVDSLFKNNPPPLGTLFISILVFTLLELWSVYAVAYKFVPLGWLFRERSRSMIALALFFSGFGHVRFSVQTRRTPNRKPEDKSALTTIFLICVLLLSPTALYRTLNHSAPMEESTTNHGELRAMIWAIHFGYDNFGRSNVQALADTMKSKAVNIIGLVETDCERTYMGNHDFVDYISEELHFYSDYGPSTAQNTWGCALLSAFPIEDAKHINLPSPEGELACMIDANLRVSSDSVVRVIVTHFGNTEDKLDLQLQTQYLANMIQSDQETQSTILIGYLTTEPFSDERYAQLIQSGLRDTSNSLDRYCEYILYKNLQLRQFLRVDKGNTSDTEAQIARFELNPIESVPSSKKTFPCTIYHNDTVQCQARKVCGWCQLRSRGSCYEPQSLYYDSCRKFQGIWVGSVPARSQRDSNKPPLTPADLKKFIDLQYQQQLKGLDKIEKETQMIQSVEESGDRFIWTIDQLMELDSFLYQYSSAIFEAQGKFW